ncbi:MAG TPA: UxaA family hydrolase [Dehalococcoidales bacterium]|nr:UxaA family hydrolase [Dehalococcoidales bacterium]
MSLSALALHRSDNVATAVRLLEKGESVEVASGGEVIKLVLPQSIPFGHKFALEDIGPGEPVVKYGETIGRATVGIQKGDHVHLHNVEGLRGRGDRT